MKNTASIVFDGSYCYDSGKVGLGIVKLDDEFNPAEVFSKCITLSSDRKNSDFVQKYGNLIAELAAAKSALDMLPPQTDINIFGDCGDMIDTINNRGTIHNKPEFAASVRCLRKSIGKHTSVNAFRVATLDAAHISDVAIAVAHNASAIASGSRKIMATPDYDGPYSHRSILTEGLARVTYLEKIRKGTISKPIGLLARRQSNFQPATQ